MFRAGVLKGAVVVGLVGMCAVVRAQQGSAGGVIHILLLNGNDGKPLPYGTNGTTKVGMSLTVFPDCGQACVFPDRSWSRAVNDRGETEVQTFAGLQRLKVTAPSDWFKYCQYTGAGTPGAVGKDPMFSVEEILRTGVVAPNRCNGGLGIKPRPGQLVFFLRPLTFWEKLAKAPQM